MTTPTKYTEMDSEWAIVVVVVVSWSVCSFLLNRPRTRGGVASRIGHRVLFASLGHPLLNHVSKHVFSLNFKLLMEMAPNMDPTWGLSEATFEKKCEIGKVCLDRAGAYGLHMSPSLEALRAPPKSKKKGTYFTTTFSINNIARIH